MARKRFGQHFLRDPHAVDSIVALVNPTPRDQVFEIGPGEGVLTAPLLESGARVTAVEIDRDLAARLRSHFAGAPQFFLYEGDVLEFPWDELSGCWKVVGNLPYNISTPIIMQLLDQARRFTSLTLMLQREVAARMAASPGTSAYGRLSVMVQRRCRVVPQLDLAPDSFAPPPKVHSTVVTLEPWLAEIDPEFESWLAEVTRVAFSMRRKVLSNALKGLRVQVDFDAAGVAAGARAEDLSVDDFVRLARSCQPTSRALG
jgi:16S rRNA (adenine1518-N6/adenine1519-N6)-dimethyltransferase